MTTEGHIEYYVLKQFAPNAEIWVGKVWKIMEDGRAWIAVKIG